MATSASPNPMNCTLAVTEPRPARQTSRLADTDRVYETLDEDAMLIHTSEVFSCRSPGELEGGGREGKGGREGGGREGGGRGRGEGGGGGEGRGEGRGGEGRGGENMEQYDSKALQITCTSSQNGTS